MKPSTSEVILILDRSGSMAKIKGDVEGGLKTFIEKQREEPGECRVSLYQFDDQYETVFEDKDINKVRSIKIEPRGWTALLDAIGKTVNSVGERLANTRKEDRPDVVLIVVISDGEENSSKEFTKRQVREMVKHQTDKYSWSFLFIGANQDSVLTGESYGFSKGNSITYAACASGVNNVFDSVSNYTSSLRSCPTSTVSFSDEDREKAVADTE